MAEFVLHVPDIDEAGKDYSFTLAPAWIESQLKDAVLRIDPAFGPGVLQVHAQENSTGEYLVTGTLRAHLLTECGRCLADAKVPVEVEFGTLFTRAPFKKADTRPARPDRYEVDSDDADDDMQREEFSGNDILLDDLIREYVMLEVPMQPLCSEACQGIPVPAHVRPPAETFGEAGGVDPRLAPLQRLRDNVPPKPQQLKPPARQPQPNEEPNRQPGQKPGSNSEKE
jgi:uncharacterized protein